MVAVVGATELVLLFLRAVSPEPGRIAHLTEAFHRSLGAVLVVSVVVTVFAFARRALGVSEHFPYFAQGTRPARLVAALFDNAWKVRLVVVPVCLWMASKASHSKPGWLVHSAFVAFAWLLWERTMLRRYEPTWLTRGVRMAKNRSKTGQEDEMTLYYEQGDDAPNSHAQARLSVPYETERPSFEQILQELDESALRGEVKNEMRSYFTFLHREHERGVRLGLLRNLIFEGSPGTGKTTAARLLARCLLSLEALDSDGYVLLTASDLDAQSNETATTLIDTVMSQCFPGVVLFDDVQLIESEHDAWGLELGRALDRSLASLTVTEREADEQGSVDASSLCCVLAGTHSDIATTLRHRSSLREHFARTIAFPDLTPPDLVTVAVNTARARGRSFAWRARQELEEALEGLYARRDGTWRGAHEAAELVEAFLIAQHERLGTSSDGDGDEISQEDVHAGVSSYQAARQRIAAAEGKGRLPLEGRSVEELLQELARLPGMSGVKDQVQEEVAVQRAEKQRLSRGATRLGTSGHLLFLGNPGTGKTTVAELVGAIYRELGVLTKGHLTVATRGDLVGEYQGHTAPRTQQLLRAAWGGVLLIDEAYALAQSDGDSFGREAIDALVGELDDPQVRDNLIVILAGYPEQMDAFLRTNPGLSSRFPSRIVFEDYSPDELLAIAYKLAADDGMTWSDEARCALGAGLTELHSARDGNTWGNAREVRNVYTAALRAKAVRDMNEDSDDLTTIERTDVIRAFESRKGSLLPT